MKIRTAWVLLALLLGCSENKRSRPEAAPGDEQAAEGEGEGEVGIGEQVEGGGAEGAGGEGVGEAAGNDAEGADDADEEPPNEGGDEGGSSSENAEGGNEGGEAEPAEGEEGGDEGAEGEGEGEGPEGAEAAEGDEGAEGDQGAEGNEDPGVCDNEADLRVLAEEDIPGVLLTCTFQCIEGPPDCAKSCLSNETGLSAECSGCFPESEACRNENCLQLCIPNRSDPACERCWQDSCGEAFTACSGLDELPEPREGPNLVDACDNEADLEVINQEPPLPLRRLTSACSFECLGGPPDCVARCLSGDTGLTVICATCWQEASSCPFRRCFESCAAEPEGLPCELCLEDLCLPEFQVCSGLDDYPEDPEEVLPDAPEDACLGEADTAALLVEDMPGVSGSCAFECLGEQDLQACSLACIAEAAGLTGDCADCFARRQSCLGANCFIACIANAQDPGCLACMEGNCDPAFEACAGRDFPPPPEGAEGEGEGEGGGGPEPDPPPVDACLAEGDLNIARGPLNLWAQMGQCGLQCLGQGADCMKDCMVQETGLNGECSECYSRFQSCRVGECFGECIGGVTPADQACGDCLAPVCLPAFASCAGYPFDDPPPAEQ